MAEQNGIVREPVVAGRKEMQISHATVFRGTMLGTTEEGEHVDRTGMLVWPASYLMCDFLSKFESKLHGIQLIELGCGVGVCAVVAGMHGLSVIATDIDSEVLEHTRSNLDANLTPQQRALCGVQCVDCTDPSAWATLPKASIVYAADVIYPLSPDEVIAGLLDTAMGILNVPGCFICSFIARDGKRTLRRLFTLTEARNLRVRVISWSCVTESEPTMGAVLLCFSASEAPDWVEGLQFQSIEENFPQLWEDDSVGSDEEWKAPMGSDSDEENDNAF